MRMQDLIERGFITNFEFEKIAITIELNEAHSDLESAKKSFEEEDFKWAIIKVYYSIFHFSRALLYKRRFREKSHFALYLFLEKLFEQNEISQKFVNYFKAALDARQNADYEGTYSKEIAENILNFAIEFKEFEKYLG